MGRGFWQTIRRMGLTALGTSSLWLGIFDSSTQGVTFGNALLKDWAHHSDGFMVAQGQPTEQPLEFKVSLLPSLTGENTPGPTFSDLQLLPDLFLPRYPSFNSQLLDQQLILYSIHLFLSGPPDVLIVGSSRAIQGVDPKTLQQALVDQGHAKLDIYNFSINGATAQVIDLLMRELLTPDQLPKLVIWADGSRAFNSGRPDRTYGQISESDGFKQLENGMHPILVHPVEAIAPSLCQDYFAPRVSTQRSPFSKPQKERSLASKSSPNLFSRAGVLPFIPKSNQEINQKTSKISQRTTVSPCMEPTAQAFLANKTTSSMASASLPEPIASASSQTPTHDVVFYQSPTIDPSISSLQHFVSRLPFDLEVNGFLPNATEFKPTIYYQNYPYVAGDYDANYVPFQLQGKQTEATHTLAKAMREKEIPLAFVNLPLTQDYLDVTRSNYEAQFLQHMQQLSAQAGFMFVDLNNVDLSQNHYFADPSHLNAKGAQAVARKIAIQNTIPWPY